MGMITIRIKYAHLVSEVTHLLHKEVTVTPETTVRDVLNAHLKRYGREFERWVMVRVSWRPLPVANILLNLRSIILYPDELDTRLKEGDTLIFGGAAGAA